MSHTARIVSTGTDFAHRITLGPHQLLADEPPALGGRDAGPAPFDLYLASLAACTAITLRMYAQKKGWDLGELRAELSLSRDADDKLHVHRTLWASGALDDAQWARLLDVAARTPVTKVMREGAVIISARGTVGAEPAR
ncbi:MAG: OsmC family protein [Proteobacteria bacterium]|nr:OsmC family protein [Pseudomonadota bacterium]